MIPAIIIAHRYKKIYPSWVSMSTFNWAVYRIHEKRRIRHLISGIALNFVREKIRDVKTQSPFRTINTKRLNSHHKIKIYNGNKRSSEY